MKIPLPASLRSPEARASASWTALRLLLAGIIAAHGWARFLAGGVPPFGGFLESQGLPFGLGLASAVTVFEIVGSILLALRRFAAPLCLLFSVLYGLGIVMVHAKAGWFVVGLGRNGAEFSVLLIACLLAVGLQHVTARNEN